MEIGKFKMVEIYIDINNIKFICFFILYYFFCRNIDDNNIFIFYYFI